MIRRNDKRQARRAERERQAKHAAADRLRADTVEAKAAQEAAMRKEAAWQAYHTPALKCFDPPDWDVQVECGNAHIRAKREIEARWAREELQLVQ